VSFLVSNESTIDIERDVNIHLENKKVSRTFFWFLWVTYAVVCMTKNCYNGSLANIVSEGVLTKSQTGAITAMFYLVYTPFQILGGMFSDRYSPERMIKIGLIGAAVANTAIFINQNYYVMLFAWIFNGIIQFGIWPSIFKIVSSQLVRSERSQMSFYISFSATAGVLISYILAAIVTNWKYNFAVSAALLLFFAIILHIFDKHINPYMKWDKNEDIIDVKGDSVKKNKDISTMKVFVASGFFFMLFGMILSVTVSQTRASLTSIMLVENYETVAPSLGNILAAVMILAGLIGNLIAGKFLKKVKNEVVFIIVMSIAKLPFLLVCTLVGYLPVSAMIAILSVVACFESITEMTKTYYTMYFTKYGLSGTAAGILNAGNAFSYMIAAYVMPRIVEKFSWHTLLVILPIMIGVAALSFCLIIRCFNKFKQNTQQKI
jgi:sugar phosphate permease